MEYGSSDITITTSDNQTSKTSYNIYGNISSSTDASGEKTIYTYDNRQNLIKVEKTDEILSECTYDSNDALLSKGDSSSTIYYYYDENHNVIKTKESFSDKEKQDIITYYVYDENGKVKLQAVYDDEIGNAPDMYDETFKYKSVSKYTYENGLLIKSEDVDNSTITAYLYDNYGNIIKSTTKIENEDGTESIGIVEDTYNILNRLVLSKSNEKETSYYYDAAGRTLLVKADGEYSRTVYDSYGRVIQEIDNSDYKPELDNLPYAYNDSTAGHTYTYAENGNLVREVNKFGIETEYTYSDTGAISRKHFDIYDYYYLPDGKCDKVEVAGKTIVDYDYDTTDESITLEKGQSLNRVTYADGNTDLQIVDENGIVVKRYNNGQSYYSTLPTASGERYRYSNSCTNTITTISSKDNVNTILKSDFSLRLTQSYQVTTHDEYVAINEQHFAKSFVTGIYQDRISFSSDYGKIDVSYNKDENTEDVTQTIKNGENTLLSSSYVYNKTKTYEIFIHKKASSLNEHPR